MNKIRFINPNYDVLFEVEDGDKILFNGEERKVIYIGDYHFKFEGGYCYHICQFAEICERLGHVVGYIGGAE